MRRAHKNPPSAQSSPSKALRAHGATTYSYSFSRKRRATFRASSQSLRTKVYLQPCRNNFQSEPSYRISRSLMIPQLPSHGFSLGLWRGKLCLPGSNLTLIIVQCWHRNGPGTTVCEKDGCTHVRCDGCTAVDSQGKPLTEEGGETLQIW